MQNMQIPQDMSYTSLPIDSFDDEFKKLSKDYEIHKTKQVKKFIDEHNPLLAYINAITPLINKYFPEYKKCIIFSEDPEFEGLDDITIYIKSFKSSFDSDWKRLDELEDELFYITEFSRKIKSLVSLDLWLK